ncbi:helix-turn-helix domain-containing protein [Vibrio breoganii]
MDEPNLVVLGHNLQQLRQAKGISLSQLALDAGIAKSNLSRLENGSGNPTLDTIWRLAVQLDVSFGSLIDSINTPTEDDGVLVQLIERGTDNPQVDAYWMSCAPHTNKLSKAHSLGTFETISVISGQIETGDEENTKLLSAGYIHRFPADKPHLYRTTTTGATLLVTINYANKEQAHEHK